MLYSLQPNPQLDYELVCLEHMVPEDHLLRHIAKHSGNIMFRWSNVPRRRWRRQKKIKVSTTDPESG